MTLRRGIAQIAIATCLCATASAQGNGVAVIPTTLNPARRVELEASRVSLIARIDAHNASLAAFNARCGQLPADATQAIASCKQAMGPLAAESAVIEKAKESFASRVEVAKIIVTDSSVVDARVGAMAGSEWVAKIPELANSPEANAIAKGFAALTTKDVAVALAWWQTALNRDSGNVALRRGVELLQWTASYRTRYPQRVQSVDPTMSGSLNRILETPAARQVVTEADRIFDALVRQEFIRGSQDRFFDQIIRAEANRRR